MAPKGQHEPGTHRKGTTRRPRLPRSEFSKGTLPAPGPTAAPATGTVYTGKRTSILGKFFKKRG